MNAPRPRMRWLAAIAVAGLLAGCGSEEITSGQAPTSERASAEDRQHLFDHVAGRAAMGERVRSLGPLTDYLPNTYGRHVDGLVEPFELWISALVVGEIVDVQPGRAVVQRSEDDWQPGDTEDDFQRDVPFDDPNAAWRTMRLTIRVDETFGDGPSLGPLPAGIGIGGRADVDSLTRALLDLGPALFLVFPDGGRLFPDTPDTWGIGGDGAFTGLIGPDGSLTFPMRDCIEEAALLEGAATLEELRARAAEPIRYVDVTGRMPDWVAVRDRTPITGPPSTDPPPPVEVEANSTRC